ncbi:MAG TPA: sigma-70 family RNA polymerase sigma factor [Anaerolineales bacterium]|nr:sigma-70 family RNA polymerase sigma factor [Anaerolineales bacterium]
MVTTSAVAVREGAINSDEARLIFSAKQGNPQAFNHLVLSYQDRIYNLALRILGDEDAAGDITQNTFLTAYINLPRFRNGSFRSWLYRIATNACYDVYRHNKRYPVQSIEDKDLVEEKLTPLDDYPSASARPEVEFERHEEERIVQSAINQLEVDQRTVLILVDQQEFDYQEAAQIMRIPVGTVKSRLARARLRLRQLLSHSLDHLQ